jgi:hypothetical protein
MTLGVCVQSDIDSLRQRPLIDFVNTRCFGNLSMTLVIDS